MDESVSQKREAIVDTAIELFRRNGFHATGVDKIVEESGATKRTLYKHFPSKDALVVAALEKHHAQFIDFFGGSTEAKASDPEDKLLAIFDVAHDWFSQDDFYGCMFINAIGEYAETRGKVRAVVQDFKQHVQAYIKDVAEKAGAKNPAALAEQLALLLEGSIVTAQVSNNPKAASSAKAIAKELINQQLTH